MKTVLITGSVGCIGSNAVRRFVQAGLNKMRAALHAQLKARSS